MAFHSPDPKLREIERKNAELRAAAFSKFFRLVWQFLVRLVTRLCKSASVRRRANLSNNDGPLNMDNIVIKPVRPRVEALLADYKHQIGDDFPAYRNHVYRAITYAMHFLDNEPEHEQLVETAFVYHDIGLWTDHNLAYLEPSEALALADNETHGWGLDPQALRGAIHWHHKVLPYSGPHQRVIEACRKADWIDASKGVVRKGLSRALIAEVESAFPNLGFHDALVRLTKEYGGSTLAGGMKITRAIVKW